MPFLILKFAFDKEKGLGPEEPSANHLYSVTAHI